MPWELIRSLLGPGLHWGKSKEYLEEAAREAEKLNNHDAAEHIRVILRLRNRVMCEPDKKKTD